LQTINKLIKAITSNLTEIYIAILLFVGIPYALSLYFGIKAFIVATVIAQTSVAILYVRKNN
jgi:hypothetical protein